MRILDGLLVDGEFFDDVLFDARIEVARRGASGVANGEGRGVGLIPLDKAKKVGFADAEHSLDIGPLNFAVKIPVQHVLDLLVGKSLMQLCHLLEPSFLALG